MDGLDKAYCIDKTQEFILEGNFATKKQQVIGMTLERCCQKGRDKNCLPFEKRVDKCLSQKKQDEYLKDKLARHVGVNNFISPE